MKRFILVAIISVLVLAGCDTTGENSISPPDDLATPTTPSPTPSPTPIILPEPIELPDVLPYDEYFSEERELIYLSMPEPDFSGYVARNGIYTRLCDDFGIMIDGALSSSLAIPGYGLFYSVENKYVYFLPETSHESVLLYESSTNELSWLRMHYPLLFFTDKTTGIRIFIPDSTVDELCDVMENNYFGNPYFSMASNVTVVWQVPNPTFDPTQPDSYLNRLHIPHFYNTLTKEHSEGLGLYPSYDEYF